MNAERRMDEDIKDATTEDGETGAPARELVELALHLEKIGADFYRALSEQCEDEKLCRFFLRMVGNEHEHERRLSELLASDKIAPHEKKAFDDNMTDHEYFARLRSVAARRVFPEGAELFEKMDTVRTVEEGLALAMEAEKNSIKLYGAISRMELTPEAVETLEWLVREEEGHLAEVSRIYRRIIASA